MHDLMRTAGKALASLILGLFSIPMVAYGTYLSVCWVRTHTSNAYYVDYPYAFAALAWVAVGLLNLYSTLRGIWRRSFYGTLFVVPVIIGLAAAETIPDHTPRLSSLVSDNNYLSNVRSSLRVWYEKNHRFPTSETELRDAAGPGPASQYKQRGNSLPYEVEVVTNADGPRLTDVAERPGVIYYCVSEDHQQFWVTMTRLQSDVDTTAHIESAAGLPQEFWMVRAAGPDYLRKEREDTAPDSLR